MPLGILRGVMAKTRAIIASYIGVRVYATFVFIGACCLGSFDIPPEKP
jgi:hypothetical protein